MRYVTFLVPAILFLGSCSAQFGTTADELVNALSKSGDTLTIHHLRWELASRDLDSLSLPFADQVADFLTRRPGIVLEIQVHCDTRVSEKRSLLLTVSRAQTLKDLLINRGICPTRLVASGMEDSEPLVAVDRIQSEKDLEVLEALHQRNRRTVLKVLATDHDKDCP